MTPICLFGGCRREAATCRCSRCGRTMHEWQRDEAQEVWSELLGLTREGKMRYAKYSRRTDRCTSCGMERKKTHTENVDH